MALRALIVEDDASVRESTAILLERNGFDALSAATGARALRLHEDGSNFDVVLLDLMLPDLDGYEVCRRIREASPVPIVIVSARTDTHEVVAGLELGADDYIVKPFEESVLLARVRAAVRRASVDPLLPKLCFGELVIDAGAFRAEVGGRSMDLTAMEFRLLVELARNPGNVLTREILLDRVWGYDYLGDSRLVDMAIKRLRTKLGDDAQHPRFISTVRGVGYRFDAHPT